VSSTCRTSFAAPLVAATAALAWSVEPTLTAGDVVGAVIAGAQASGRSVTVAGRSVPVLDVHGAVEEVIAACEAGGQAFDPATGRCAGCVPDCAGKPCLADDGCGGECSGLALRTCEDNVLHYCQEDGPGTTDCSSFGRQCLPDPAAGGVLRCVYVERCPVRRGRAAGAPRQAAAPFAVPADAWGTRTWSWRGTTD
jgi:hypothetical protein